MLATEPAVSATAASKAACFWSYSSRVTALSAANCFHRARSARARPREARAWVSWCCACCTCCVSSGASISAITAPRCTIVPMSKCQAFTYPDTLA